jgi:TonB family protein
MRLTLPRNPYTAASLSLVPGAGHLFWGNQAKGYALLATGMLNTFLLLATMNACSYARLFNQLLEGTGLETNTKFYQWIKYFSPGNPITAAIFILSISLIVYAVVDSYRQARQPSLADESSCRLARLRKTDSALAELFSVSYLVHFLVLSLITLTSVLFALPYVSHQPPANVQIILCQEPVPEYKPDESNLATDDHQSLINSSTRLKRKCEHLAEEAIPTRQSMNEDRVSVQIKRKNPAVTTPTDRQERARSAQMPSLTTAPAEEQVASPPEQSADSDTSSERAAPVAVSSPIDGAGTDGLIQAQLAEDSSKASGDTDKSMGRTDSGTITPDPGVERSETLLQDVLFHLSTTNYRLPPNIVPNPEKANGLYSCLRVPIRILPLAPTETPPTLIPPDDPDRSCKPDLVAYMADLERRIKRAWFPPRDCMQFVRRPVVDFKLDHSGNVSNVHLFSSGGTKISDQAALDAVANAAPFRPLPEGAGLPKSVEIQFTFDYNVFNSRNF